MSQGWAGLERLLSRPLRSALSKRTRGHRTSIAAPPTSLSNCLCSSLPGLTWAALRRRRRSEQVGAGGSRWEKVGEGEGGGGGRRCEGREVAADRARWREVAGDRERSREIGRGRLLEADDEAGVAVDEAARPLVAQQHHLLEIVRHRPRSCEERAEIVRDAWRTCAPSLSCSEGGTRHAALPSPKNCEIEARSRRD